jgi:hypothetical protein
MTTTTTTIDLGVQQKKRRQVILLAIGGGLLALLLVFQLPKLLGGDESAPASESSATESAPVSPEATTSTAPASTGSGTSTSEAPALVIPAGEPLGTAYVGGVVVPGGFAVEPGEGDLLVFSMLKAKDPFVQQVDDKPATVGTDAGASPATPPTPAATASKPEPLAPAPSVETTPDAGAVAVPTANSGTTTGTDTVPLPPEKPPVLTYATVSVNGKPIAITLKTPFPAPANLFVVPKLTDTSAQLAIAGSGSFTGGRDTVTLAMGKQLTLVDQATGVRYALKLLYTGTSPEQVEGFSTTPAAEASVTPAETSESK